MKVFSWDITWNTIFRVFLYFTLGVLSWNAELGIHTEVPVLWQCLQETVGFKQRTPLMMNRLRRTKSRQRNDCFGSNEKNENSRVWNWLVDYFWISSQNKTPPVPPTSGLRSPAVSPRKLSPFRQTTGHKKGAKGHKFSPETGDWRWKQERH